MAKVTPNEQAVVEVPDAQQGEMSLAGNAPGNPATPEPASFAVAINVDLLNTELTGIFERRKVSEDKNRTALLIIPTDKPKGGMTLMELVTEVNGIISAFTGSDEKVSEEQIKQSL